MGQPLSDQAQLAPAAQSGKEFHSDVESARFVLTEARVRAILNTKHFAIIYERTLVNDDDDKFVSMLRQCDDFCLTIATSRIERLRQQITIIDSCLIPCLPVAEMRALILAICERDVNLISDMPQVKKMLRRTLRAIEISPILDSATLNRITADIKNQKLWGAP